MKPKLYKVLFASLSLLCAAPCLAEVPPLEPLHYEARYDVDWNGIPLGRIRVTIHEDTFGYRLTVDTETHGVIAILESEHASVTAEGAIHEGQYVPVKYDSRGDSQRHTTLTYDADGHIATRSRTPMDDPKWRAVVPLEEANSAVDPVSAFFIVRKQIHDHIAHNVRDNSVRTYEGARLAEMDFRVISPTDLKIMDIYQHAINVVATRKLVDGYTPKEKKRYDKGDPVVHLYFSADGKFIPLKATADMRWGMLSATLTEIK